MDASLWPSTIASFCEDVAGSNPAPAGVAASAVAASLGLSLLIKVLEIAGRRKSFAGDAQKLRALVHSAHRELAELKSAADDDIQAVRTGGRNAIEVPMRAARAAVAGLDLCVEGTGIEGVTKGLAAADLGAAVLLLSGAARAILLCVAFNLRAFDSDETYRAAIADERQALEDRASHRAEAALTAVLP
jgi:formiminotetrahydrofolate cyclodeaminase